MSRATTLDRLAIKTPESAFVHVLQEGFNFSPRVSRELLSTAKEMLVGSVPSAAARPGQARLVVASLKAVERYLEDYERVKLLLKRRVGVEETSSLIGRGKHVVLEYVEIARQYHLKLFTGSD